MNSKGKFLLLILFTLLMIWVEHHFRIKNYLQKMYVCWNEEVEEPQLSAWFNSKTRPDVITVTDWLAPVIWEGTFNRGVLEKYYKRLNITIGLVAFGTEKFIDRYLEQFLKSADKYFMVGYNVIFYILLGNITKIPYVELGTLRTFKIFPLLSTSSWKDRNYMYMHSLNLYLKDYIQYEVDFLFSMAINQVFQSDFGVETLGTSVAQLHAWWCFRNNKEFPYERRIQSAASIPFGEGDFYYHQAIIGGTPQEVSEIIIQYLQGFMHDTKFELDSIYESHLNKYFFANKPTKLLSPEYNWDPNFRTPPQIKQIKIAYQSETI